MTITEFNNINKCYFFVNKCFNMPTSGIKILERENFGFNGFFFFPSFSLPCIFFPCAHLTMFSNWYLFPQSKLLLPEPRHEASCFHLPRGGRRPGTLPTRSEYLASQFKISASDLTLDMMRKNRNRHIINERDIINNQGAITYHLQLDPVIFMSSLRLTNFSTLARCSLPCRGYRPRLCLLPGTGTWNSHHVYKNSV